MRFFTTATVALTAFASTVYGLAAPAPATVTAPAAVPTVSGVSVSGGSNPIRQPLGDVALEAGQPFTIKWYVGASIFLSPYRDLSSNGVTSCRKRRAMRERRSDVL